MSRVIKFRAWHHAAKEMLQVGDDNGTTHPLDCCAYFMQGQPVTLMQFTGLHDVNGVEIYEGDVVASPHFTDAAGRKHILRHFVEWSEKYQGWFLANATSADGTGSIQMFVARGAELEVIGNIYQNSDLLS